MSKQSDTIDFGAECLTFSTSIRARIVNSVGALRLLFATLAISSNNKARTEFTSPQQVMSLESSDYRAKYARLAKSAARVDEIAYFDETIRDVKTMLDLGIKNLEHYLSFARKEVKKLKIKFKDWRNVYERRTYSLEIQQRLTFINQKIVETMELLEEVKMIDTDNADYETFKKQWLWANRSLSNLYRIHDYAELYQLELYE